MEWSLHSLRLFLFHWLCSVVTVLQDWGSWTPTLPVLLLRSRCYPNRWPKPCQPTLQGSPTGLSWYGLHSWQAIHRLGNQRQVAMVKPICWWAACVSGGLGPHKDAPLGVPWHTPPRLAGPTSLLEPWKPRLHAPGGVPGSMPVESLPIPARLVGPAAASVIDGRLLRTGENWGESPSLPCLSWSPTRIPTLQWQTPRGLCTRLPRVRGTLLYPPLQTVCGGSPTRAIGPSQRCRGAAAAVWLWHPSDSKLSRWYHSIAR